MNYKTVVAGAAVLALSFGAYFRISRGETNAAVKMAATGNAVSTRSVIAAPGRVEPLSEEIRIGSELNGKLSDVRVEEGDRVARGQVLAVLVNADYSAQVDSAAAQVADKQAELQKLNAAAQAWRRPGRCSSTTGGSSPCGTPTPWSPTASSSSCSRTIRRSGPSSAGPTRQNCSSQRTSPPTWSAPTCPWAATGRMLRSC